LQLPETITRRKYHFSSRAFKIIVSFRYMKLF